MKIPETMKLISFIPKSEHGSRTNWVLCSGLKISVSSVLGAVGILLALKVKRYLEFGSSDQDVASPRFWVVPGLENFGNNCFLNVILQALASCLSFRKYLREMVEEHGSLSIEGGDESVPLVGSLTSLVEELCIVRHERTVLSPRNLMLAMDQYIPDFNLAKQQDVEETFSHLLFSLREEISDYFVPKKSGLANLSPLLNENFLKPKSSEEESDWQRWKRSFVKPFDGILGSFLICQSCSFQISLDFQLFHSLHLSPPIGSGATIMAGCALEDCLKQFVLAEQVENYCCSNCWHSAAVEYVSAFVEDKADVEKLQRCNKNYSCDCKTLSCLEAFPWSNRFSRTFKQLSIARSPKILCIHLQRASYNMFGQSVKLLGHVSFPLILDLTPFMNTGIGLKYMGPKSSNWDRRESRSFPYSKYQNMLIDSRTLSPESSTTKMATSETDAPGEEERNLITFENGPCSKASSASLIESRSSTNVNATVALPSRRQMYRLVSVVVHFGTSGSGHYTVYRKVRARIGDEDPIALLESAIEQWFCISDSEVHIVSEKDVMDANASMLFYERIESS